MIGRISNFLSQETKLWFRYEKQIHALLLSDPVFENIRDVLGAQISLFHYATRGFEKSTLSATFSFDRSMPMWSESDDRALMAEIVADNGEGRVFSGSGMLASIDIKTPKLVAARSFSFIDPRHTNQVPGTQSSGVDQGRARRE